MSYRLAVGAAAACVVHGRTREHGSGHHVRWLGVGASDSLWDPAAASAETNADITLAVLDAVHASRVVIFDATGGGGSLTFAATYPQRVQSLIVGNLRQSYLEVRAISPAGRRDLAEVLHGLRSLELQNPRVAHEPELRTWWARARRLLYSPEQALEQVEYAARADYEAVLPALRAPTLVLHRRDNRMFDIETSRETASRIPNARFVELPGSESDLFLGDTRPVFAAIEQFLAEPDAPLAHDRPLLTVLFTASWPRPNSSPRPATTHGASCWTTTTRPRNNWSLPIEAGS